MYFNKITKDATKTQQRKILEEELKREREEAKTGLSLDVEALK
jgi:hypothetical protein